MDELIELDVAALLLDRDDGVAELDQIFLLQPQNFFAHLLGARFRGIGDDDEVFHDARLRLRLAGVLARLRDGFIRLDSDRM